VYIDGLPGGLYGAPVMIFSALAAISMLSAPPACLSQKTCEEVTFEKPLACDAEKWRWRKGRKYRQCRTHKTLKVYVDKKTGTVRATRQGSRTSPGGRRRWIFRERYWQWARCGVGWGGVRAKNPKVFKWYKDPDQGGCLIYRPKHGVLSPEIAKKARTRNLHRLHPYVAEAARELVRRAYKAGIAIKIISTYRRHRHKKNWRTKKYKSYSHWHAWGMSFDINLIGFRSLSKAKKLYKRDKRKWERLGRISESLGVYWGGRFKRPDIFHFEWHPGHSGYVRLPIFLKFLKLAGPNGERYRRIWRLFPHPDLKAALRSKGPNRVRR
jgi:peptidoglycan L-alanyl-D-glutamate endopeptidase CwlK